MRDAGIDTLTATPCAATVGSPGAWAQIAANNHENMAENPKRTAGLSAPRAVRTAPSGIPPRNPSVPSAFPELFRTRRANGRESARPCYITESRRLYAHDVAGTREFGPEDLLDAEPVLPGFRVKVAEFFVP